MIKELKKEIEETKLRIELALCRHYLFLLKEEIKERENAIRCVS